MDRDIASLDWCDDTTTKTLPWDSDQFVTVKRFTAREKRKRQSLAGTFRIGPEISEQTEIQMTYDRLKDFEWETAIVDYRLKDKNGKVYLFADAKSNRKIYDHISGDLEKFIDDLILTINKEKSTEVVSSEVKEVEGNSEGLSEKS